MNAWQVYLREVRGHLETLRAMGITELVLPLQEEMPAETPRAQQAQSRPIDPGTPARSARPEPPRAALPRPERVGPQAPTSATAAVPLDDSLDRIQADLIGCRQCKLCEGRSTVVVGAGNPNARLMFVGEGPGDDEDRTGQPFIGEAGQLLTKIIGAMGLTREDVYLTNIVKCKPPNNRRPFLDETEQCYPFLRRQIAVVKPEIIVTLGPSASQVLLEVTMNFARLRGTFYRYGDIKIMPTYHPDVLLRNPKEKAAVWADMKKVMAELGLEAKTPT